MVSVKAFEKELVRREIIDQARLERAKAEAEKTGVRLVDVIAQKGYASCEVLYRCLAEFCEFRYVVPSKLEISPEITKVVPARFATHYSFVPVHERNDTLVVAVSDPLNGQLLDDIRLVLKRRIEPVVATPQEIDKVTKSLYGVGADTMERILSETENADAIINLETNVGADLGDEKIDASIIKFVNELFTEAIRAGATDIHIEPFEDMVRVRYRIDGILHQVTTPPTIRGFHPAIVSRVKIMAVLNIAEKRMPQDGKIVASLGDEQYDLRVSILPTPHGETINIRILTRSSMFLTMEALGFLPGDLRLFETLIHRPHGIILVTGPTGSGKTTTLYAALSKLNDLEHKIITIEDPIEYQLRGVTQMQIHEHIGFDFATGLRSILRHDPDIMMVGEIRDFETAEMAIRSSLTGHLVFSTLHTNDAAGAVTRLTDMGVEPFLIASTMIAVVAQRLVRRVCSECAVEFRPAPEVFAEFRVKPEDYPDAQFRKAPGCEACRFTGYRGRMAIYEILPFDRAIQELTIQRASSTHIRRQACKQGMRTLRQAGWERVCKGETTCEEVLRVTSEADVSDAIETGDAPVQV